MTHPARKESQPYRAEAYQPWATAQVDKSHEEALYGYGELCLYTLMWRPQDHEDGLVQRCSTCWGGARSRQAEAFRQPTTRECPDCFGTTFDGGFRAQIVRPTLFADRNHEISEEARGYITSDTLQVETTGDFTMNKGDFLFRFDNDRYQMEQKREVILRAGFAPPVNTESFGGTTTAHLEDETSVAFKIPPTNPADVLALLGKTGPFVVADIVAGDVIAPNGYLI